MSGDVQPRKRKDKKKRKDELGIEEPRGTAAALGDGDVFMHSQHDHGTGGHWCAKIIFFSLLAVLITLIGLIILENRGLTDLEANSVETKYSGVLEGWIEEPSEDDHYDAHTLDLNHPEEDEHHDTEANYDHEDDDHEDEDHDEEGDENEDHDDEEEDHEEDEDHEDETDNVDDNEDSEENLEEADEESEEKNTYRQYVHDEKYEDDDDDDKSIEAEDKDDDENEDDIDLNDDELDQGFYTGNNLEAESDEDQDEDENDDNSNEYQEAQQASNEHNIEEDNLEDDDDQDGEEDEIEKIEAETQDWESYEEEEKATSRDDDVSNEIRSERSLKDSKEISKENEDDEDEGFEDTEDDDEPPVERITTPPAGKPFVEIEEEIIQKPIDTLAEEAAYEKKQEELRRQKEEEAQASQIWLKLAVGGALLVATHAVLRRATSSRDAPEPEERSREETPSVIDRRMTLIAEEPPKVASPSQTSRQIVDEEVFKKPAPVVKTAPIVKPNIEEVVKEKATSFIQTKIPDAKDEDKELYSDEDEEVEEEELEEEEVQPKIKVAPQQAPVQTKEKEEDSETEEVPDDVEIIEDEQIEEELEEEEDEVEEEISDVDDAELLSRLEAKYGRLPEPERPGKQHKDGGNSIEDQWPGEPSDPYWREQLDLAEEELRQGSWALCEKLVSAPQLSDSGRARWILAKALDATAEAKRDNVLLSKAISAYLNLLKMNERISDKNLVEVAQRTIDRIHFRGTYLNAEPIYRLLIRRFPNDVNYRNNLTVSFLMANRADLAEEVLKETLKLWPHDRIALAHHGFVLKNQHNKLEEAVVALEKALEGDSGPANEARFYYHLGDALLSLGRFDEAHEVHKRGTKLGYFLSPSQRSLYNVPRLKSSPWWPVEHTPYVKLARALENSWREILKEGELAKALYEKEKEGLKERGEWSQLDIFVRGREIPGRCKTAPVTCSIVRSEVAAVGCRRGQIKFSAIEPGTHIRPHVGPTNCRLRMHLGLKNTKDTYIRVDKETRQWQVGKTFIFDDSFEHEVWHNGTGSRLVLIVDLWHPQLTPQERKQLPAI